MLAALSTAATRACRAPPAAAALAAARPVPARALARLSALDGGADWADFRPADPRELGWQQVDAWERAEQELAAAEEAEAAAAAAAPRAWQVEKRNIRGSWRKLNLVAQQVRGKTVPDALAEMRFSSKRKSLQVTELLRRGCWHAKERGGLEPLELRVKRCWVGKGRMQPQVWFRGRGRVDVRKRRWAHLFLEVEEIDDEAEPLPAGRSARATAERKRAERAAARAARVEAALASVAAPAESQ